MLSFLNVPLIKEWLSIAVGPMTEEELPTGPQLKTLLQTVGDTLACRKVHGTHKCNKTKTTFVWMCLFLLASHSEASFITMTF